MISAEKFINVIHELFLNPLLIESWGFNPRWSIKILDYALLFTNPYSSASLGKSNGKCIWWHEEPLNKFDMETIQYSDHYITYSKLSESNAQRTLLEKNLDSFFLNDCNITILANSEISDDKKQFLKKWQIYDWYFFFHGFAALSWFKDYKYLNFSHYSFDKVFICLNHLITNNRSYRLNLLSHLKEKNLLPYGHVSCPLLSRDLVKEEVTNFNSKLSSDAKKHIFRYLYPDSAPLILDNINYNDASSKINEQFMYDSLWNVVTETIFYEDKLHLTEKIFKPIVTKRPFILVSSSGNLNYIKSYGFKTFDRWIDESYDNERDHDRRISMIVAELEKLCKLPKHELIQMHLEMQEILEYNFNHFYGDFKNIIIKELIDNFDSCMKQYNLHLSQHKMLPVDNLDLEHIYNFIAN
jgi:hypothetical protein